MSQPNKPSKEQLVAAIAIWRNEAYNWLKPCWRSAAPKACWMAREAMTSLAARYDKGEYLPELIIAARSCARSDELSKPRLAPRVPRGPARQSRHRHVAGDIHDLGKGIVSFMLDVNNYQWWTWLDVPPPNLSNDQRNQARCGPERFLTLAFEQMKRTWKPSRRPGLASSQDHDRRRHSWTTGRPFSGLDAIGADAAAAVTLHKSWTEESSHV